MSSISTIPNEVAILDHARLRPRFPSGRIVWSTAITTAVFILGFLITESLEGHAVEAPAEDLAPVASNLPPELPRELQWHWEPLTFDHMYRKIQTRNDPWIRIGGKRQ